MDETIAQPVKRPLPVTIAAWLMGISTALFLVRAFLYLDWKDPYTYLSVSLFTAISLLWIYLVFRCKNWARWVLAVLVVITMGAYLGQVQKVGVNWNDVDIFRLLSSLTGKVLQLAEAFLLFFPSSNVWFRGSKRPVGPRV